MGLSQVDSETISGGSTATVTLTWINSDDVYVVIGYGIENTSDGEDLRGRVTTGGTPDTDSEYDWALKLLKATGSYANEYNSNQDYWRLADGLGNATNEEVDLVMYLYNFNSSSEFSYYTLSNAWYHLTSGVLMGYEGGGLHSVEESNDGISFHFENANNFTAGTFTLYRIT